MLFIRRLLILQFFRHAEFISASLRLKEVLKVSILFFKRAFCNNIFIWTFPKWRILVPVCKISGKFLKYAFVRR
jgi:hypothetical protein